jgi:hypothetical protein
MTTTPHKDTTMTTTDYTKLDAAIIRRIADGARGLHVIAIHEVADIASSIARKTGRDQFRVIDARLQALRKLGLITHTRATTRDAGGWRLAEGVGA